MLPGFGEGESVTKGMQGTIGRILRDRETGQQLPRSVIYVECVVAKQVPPSKRSKPGPKDMISWPDKMFHNGREVEAQTTSQLTLVDDEPDGSEGPSDSDG